MLRGILFRSRPPLLREKGTPFPHATSRATALRKEGTGSAHQRCRLSERRREGEPGVAGVAFGPDEFAGLVPLDYRKVDPDTLHRQLQGLERIDTAAMRDLFLLTDLDTVETIEFAWVLAGIRFADSDAHVEIPRAATKCQLAFGDHFADFDFSFQ